MPHQRATGALDISLGGAGLMRLEARAPLRALFPTPEPGEPPQIALLNCAGGLAGGDQLAVRLVLGVDTAATAAAVAAEKVYRSLGPAARIATTLELAPGASLEWLPQETILFDGARLERRMVARLDVGARLLAVELLAFGRGAHGEAFCSGSLFDGWRLHGPTGLVWADSLAIDDPRAFAGVLRGGSAGGMATLLLAGPDAPAGIAPLRALGAAATLARPEVLVARWLGPPAALRAAVGAAIVTLRAAVLGRPARLPRLWTG